jgi:hypothetical protein
VRLFALDSLLFLIQLQINIFLKQPWGGSGVTCFQDQTKTDIDVSQRSALRTPGRLILTTLSRSNTFSKMSPSNRPKPWTLNDKQWFYVSAVGTRKEGMMTCHLKFLCTNWEEKQVTWDVNGRSSQKWKENTIFGCSTCCLPAGLL